MSRLLPFGFFVFALAAAGTAALAPADGQTVAVVSAPWSRPGRAVDIAARAGGSLVDIGLGGRLVLARSDTPGFAARLYREGATLVLRADGPLCSGFGA